MSGGADGTPGATRIIGPMREMPRTVTTWLARRLRGARLGAMLACALALLAGAQSASLLAQGTPAAPPAAQQSDDAARVTLVALLTGDGQRIDQGVVWRVFQDAPGDGKSRLVSTHREASPELRLAPGTYMVNAAFGRAHLTRRITVKAGAPAVEKFVLNAGGLKIDATLEGGEALPTTSVHYDILSDERDQFGNRTRIMTGVRPGLIIRLNAGLYHIVSTYGDANATVRADVTVEAGKLTSATVAHVMSRVTFKLVQRAGGHAIADTQWLLQLPSGEPVKESVGALPTHILAPGSYSVVARSGGRTFKRDFAVQSGDVVQVEVVME
jgi:hypothetical protein